MIRVESPSAARTRLLARDAAATPTARRSRHRPVKDSDDEDDDEDDGGDRANLDSMLWTLDSWDRKAPMPCS